MCDIHCPPTGTIPLPGPGREDPGGRGGGKNREQNPRMVWVGSDLTDHLIPAPSTGLGCSECFGESAVGDQAAWAVSLGLMAASPLGQELPQKDIYIPSADWWGPDWRLYHAGGCCPESLELWRLKVKMWDAHMGVEQDPSQNRDEQALAEPGQQLGSQCPSGEAGWRDVWQRDHQNTDSHARAPR